LCASLTVRDHVSHPCRTTGKSYTCKYSRFLSKSNTGQCIMWSSACVCLTVAFRVALLSWAVSSVG
jgi:hypothetical protein